MKYIVALIILTLLLVCFKTISLAQMMENKSYTLTTPDETATIANQSPEVAILKNGKVQPGVYSTADYSVIIGNGNESAQPLRLKSSSNTISYKELVPNEPIIRDHTLSIYPGSSLSYTLFLFEESSLTDDGGSIIPDTSCDSGTCSEDYPGAWTNPLTYGFGFSCIPYDSSVCPETFSKKDTFQPLPNKKTNKDKMLLFTGVRPTTTTFQYKVNINPTQVKGIYQNTINYILLPTL